MNTPRTNKARTDDNGDPSWVFDLMEKIETELAEVAKERDQLRLRVSTVETANADLAAERDELKANLETAERDSGLYCATLKLSAQKLGCDEHMVDHAVADLIAERDALLRGEYVCKCGIRKDGESVKGDF